MTVNLGELIAATLRGRAGDLADNISNKNALLFRLGQSDKIEIHKGGRTIVKELEYAEKTIRSCITHPLQLIQIKQRDAKPIRSHDDVDDWVQKHTSD